MRGERLERPEEQPSGGPPARIRTSTWRAATGPRSISRRRRRAAGGLIRWPELELARDPFESLLHRDTRRLERMGPSDICGGACADGLAGRLIGEPRVASSLRRARHLARPTRRWAGIAARHRRPGRAGNRRGKLLLLVLKFEVAGVGGRDRRLAEEHRLGQRQPETLGSVERHVAVGNWRPSRPCPPARHSGRSRRCRDVRRRPP